MSMLPNIQAKGLYPDPYAPKIPENYLDRDAYDLLMQLGAGDTIRVSLPGADELIEKEFAVLYDGRRLILTRKGKEAFEGRRRFESELARRSQPD